jgi:hypothetical protein
VEPSHVLGILQQLGFQAPAMVVPETKLVLVPESFPEVDQVSAVIKALDVRANDSADAEPKP